MYYRAFRVMDHSTTRGKVHGYGPVQGHKILVAKILQIAASFKLFLRYTCSGPYFIKVYTHVHYSLGYISILKVCNYHSEIKLLGNSLLVVIVGVKKFLWIEKGGLFLLNLLRI